MTPHRRAAQKLIFHNYYRPSNPAAADPTDLERFPQVKLVAIDHPLFGGWVRCSPPTSPMAASSLRSTSRRTEPNTMAGARGLALKRPSVCARLSRQRLAAKGWHRPTNVRFGSLADITARSRRVRFTPDSGHSSVRVGVRKVPTAVISRSGKPRRHSAGGSPQPNSSPLGQGRQVYRFVLNVIEVTCAGVTELPSVGDARHC
jgi:hypothetical protein